MTEEVKYGTVTKKIIFTETDHNHAKLIIRLKHDGLTQASFFRELVRGYLKGDERIQNFIDEIKQQSIKHKTKSKRLRTTGKENLKSLTLKDSEIENIFDLLEEEYPEL
mgnify:FL=1